MRSYKRVGVVVLVSLMVGLLIGPAQAAVSVSFQSSSRAFSPNGDGQEDSYGVSIYLSASSNVTLLVKDPASATVATLASNQSLSSGHRSFEWDGRDDLGAIAPDGRYTITASAVDADGIPSTATLPVDVDTRTPGTVVAPTPGASLSGSVTMSVDPHPNMSVQRVSFSLPGCGSTSTTTRDGNGRFVLSKDVSTCTSGERGLSTTVTWRDAFNVDHSYAAAAVPVTVLDSTAPTVGEYNSPRRVLALSAPGTLESTSFYAYCTDSSAMTGWQWDLKDSGGTLVRSLAPSGNSPLACSNSGSTYDSYVTFDGTDAAGNRLPDGSYTVTATVTDAGGLTGTRTWSVDIDTRVPGTLEKPTAGQTLSGRPQFDFVPTVGTNVRQVRVQLRSTSIYVYNASADGHWRTTYPMGGFAAGAAPVRAYVTWRDAFNVDHTFTYPQFEVAIDPTAVPLEARLEPATGTAPFTSTLRVNTSDPNDASLLVRVDWGDGSAVQTSNLASPYGERSYEHEFTRPGVYNVFVSVSNGAGGYASKTIPVTANGQPNQSPELTADVTPTSGAAPLEVSVSIDGTDPDDDDLTYKVDWGDGTAPTTGAYPGAAPAAHTYSQPGTYLVVASVSDGSLTAARSTRVTAVLPEPVSASAGDDQVAALGKQVTFDASGSRPAGMIGSYVWDFGDGATASGRVRTHTYDRPGRYTVKLTATATNNQSSTDTAVVEVVEPEPERGLFVTVRRPGGGALSGAEVLVVQPDGSRVSSRSDSSGEATLIGLPDGALTAYVWADGYRPVTVAAEITNGRGEAAVTMESGEVGTATIEHHEMTIEEIEEAGIEVADPANYHVYEATINLFFVPDGEEDVPDPQVIKVHVTPDGVRCFANCGGGGAGGGGGGSGGTDGGPVTFGDHQWIPEVTYVDDQPVIQWLVLPMRASWLKEFFEVKLVVQNLTDGFTFGDGVAALPLPSGLSLAPTATDQTEVQSVPPIPGGGSAAVTWVVRGDQEGDYDLLAEYSATVNPINRSIRLVGRSKDPLRVDGASALETTIVADCKAARWAPYGVQFRVKNVSTSPVYNFQIEMLDRPADAPDTHADFFYAPMPPQVQGTGAIAPGATWVADYVVFPGLGNDEVQNFRLVLEESFVQRTGGDVDLDPLLTDNCAEAGAPDPSLGPNSGYVRVDMNGEGSVATLSWLKPTAPDGVSVTGFQLWARQSLRSGAWTLVDDVISPAVSGETRYAIPSVKAAIGRFYAVGTVYSDGRVDFRHKIGEGPARYVALGDSFSSGEGVPAFEPGTAADVSPVEDGEKYPLDTLCHRSAMGSYSRILANDRSYGSALEPAVFKACSGAVSADVWSANGRTGNEGVPAQASEINQFTDVVTLTMGGNDIGFSDIATVCVVVDCVGQVAVQEAIGSNEWLDAMGDLYSYGSEVQKRVEAVTGAGKSCKGVLAKLPRLGKVWCAVQAAKAMHSLEDMGTIEPDRWANSRNIYNGRLRQRLTRTYTEIHQRAPRARIYVAGYPQLVDRGGSGSCDLLVEGLPVSLTRAERLALYDVVNDINSEISEAVSAANRQFGNALVTYVTPVGSAAFRDRELCKDGRLNTSSGFNSLVNEWISTPDNYGPTAYSFHPNKYGQEAYAELFAERIDRDISRQLLTFPGRTADAGEVFVPFGARHLTITTSIPGSTVTPRIFAPDGTQVDLGGAGVTFASTPTTTTTVITSPEPGSWAVRVHGDDVSALGEPTTVTAWAEDAPSSAPLAVATVEDLGSGELSFDASESRAATDATYEWLFSDGSTAAGVSVTHDFGTAPYRWATVTVSDDSGVDLAGAGMPGANQAPRAADDQFVLAKDVPLDEPAPGILANDSDADGDILWPVVVDGPLHGTVDITANGAFSYTPDQGFVGTDTFSYRASDGTHDSDRATVTLVVQAGSTDTFAAPIITSGAPPGAGTVGGAYGFTFTATGNPPPTFSVASGSLPVGLSLSSAGVLSGTPTAAGTSTFSITATNAKGSAQAGPFSIQVSMVGTPPPTTPPSPTPPPPPPSPTTAIGDLALAKPKIKGPARVGAKLRVAHPGGLPDGWRVTYQWLRAGKPVKGSSGTKAAYKINRGDRGKRLTVRLVYSAPGFKPWKVTAPLSKRVR